MSPPSDVLDDLLGADVTRDPHSYLRRLREEDPVHYNPRLDAWVLTRYDDVCASFRDPRLSSDRVAPFAAKLPAGRREACRPVLDALGRWMVFKDPPEHTRLRSLVAQAFAPPAIRAREPLVQRLVGELLDDFVRDGGVDLIAGFAAPLSALVIAELVGVPAADRELFKRCSDELAVLVFGSVDVEDRYERAAAGQAGLRDLFASLIERYRAQPGDNLVSLLVHGDGGGQLDEEDLTAMCVLMLFAGHETTTNLIANAVVALVDHPDELAAVRDDPSVAASAVEEFLRYDGPSKISPRWVIEDLELRGRHIRAGQRVYPVQSAANRDPARFPDPDRLDVRRSPNPHVAFGHGVHSCIGAPLARLETRIAIGEILRWLPGLRIVERDLPWRPSVLARGMDRLAVAYDAPSVRAGELV
jgi:cytochrome P450